MDFIQKNTSFLSNNNWNILFDFISPAHFNPAYFEPNAIIIVIVICIGALISYHYTDKTENINRCIKLIYTILFTLGIALICSIKPIRINIIVNMFFWPLTPILILLCFTLLIRNLINLIKNKWILFFIIITFFFILSILPLKNNFLYTHLIAIIFIYIGLFLIIKEYSKSLKFWISSILFIVASFFWCHYQLPLITTKIDSQIDMFIHCKELSSPNSNFLIHPELSGFRTVAERAIFVDRSSMPRKPDELYEWARRLQIVYNVQDIKEIQEKKFEEVDPEYIRILIEKYKFTHFITSISHKHLDKFLNYGFQILHQNKNYILFKTNFIPKKTKENKEKHLLLI